MKQNDKINSLNEVVLIGTLYQSKQIRMKIRVRNLNLNLIF